MSDHRRLGNTSDAPGAVSSVDPKKTAEPKSSAEDEQEAFHETFEVLPAGAKDGKNKAPIQKEPTRKPPKVKNIVGNKNSLNPSREISVKWDKPDLKGDFQYEVYLKGDTEYKPVSVDTSRQEAWFKDLKSDTKYIAHVSIMKNEKKSESACSKPIYTSKAPRIKGFKIATDGKPIIKLCSSAPANNGASLVSQFKWGLPDIGVEKTNYNVVGTQASMRENGGAPKELTVEDEVRAKPVALKFGTSYNFSVKRTYWDLDRYEMIDAISECTVYTEIGTPEIRGFECHDQEITVLWSSAKGATKHTLEVRNELGEFVTERTAVNEQSFTFQMTRSCNYGKICILVIKASGMDKSTKSDPKHCLIGGDTAVTDVVAKKSDQCPRREIVLKWKPPKLRPQGYKVQLYVKEKGKYKEDPEVVPLEQTQLSHKFKELKTSTQYYCKVMPIYHGAATNGSMSNEVETDKRIKQAFETEDDFGVPVEIVHTNKDADSKGLAVTLSWKRRLIGENFKLFQQQLAVSRPKFIGKKVIYNELLSPTVTEVGIKELELGHKFDVKLTTTLIDLDTEKKSHPTKEYFFHSKPSKTQLNDCKYKDGLITFSWGSVEGAERYRLEIKDEFLGEEISQPEIIPGNKCEVKVQSSEKLCMGRTCMTRVIAYVNDMTSESHWKAHLIGGALVPRNVKAMVNSDNPKRSILVTFDAPKKGPAEEYKVVAIPENGKRKTFFCSTGSLLIEYLRKGIRYKFQVHARHGEKWSEGSMSNYQETQGDASKHTPVSFSGMKGTLNMQNAKVHGNTAIVNMPKGVEFGKVRDLTMALNPHGRYEKEILILSWKVPTFDNNAFDYKVEKYNVEIRIKGSNKVVAEFPLDFKKKLDKYSTTPQELDLGETYEMSVSTIYTDIDQDQDYLSNAEKAIVQTRPCKPSGGQLKVDKNDKGEEGLKIEWNLAKGAEYYEMAIYTDDSGSEPFKKVNTGKKTKWHQPFGEGFGYGTSYCVVITAFGGENKTNFVTTDRKTIGGDFSPKKVHASIKHDEVIDPNTQIYLSWEPPAKPPESYEVSYENAGKPEKISCKETKRLITGLKAGEYYTFKVVAIHTVFKNKSGGSLSNRVRTNPTPTQVKNLGTSLGNNPSTSIKVYWDKVDAEKKDETAFYRITVMTSDEASRREINNIKEESFHVSGLEPDTTYFIMVAGGNSIGFGKDSEKCFFKTDLGMPKNVRLLNNATTPSTSLILKYSEAEGGPLKHVCVLYKNQNEQISQTIDDVQSGHSLNDLDPNTDYFAVVYAVFENEKTGKAIKSEVVLTAPSQPEIYEHQCCIDNKINSSKDLYLKWKSDTDCKEHEIQIRHAEGIENQLTVKNKNDLRYSCQHEASRYTARVRTKNLMFGPWSDEVVIALAPKKLIHVGADLEKEGSNILITCKKVTSSCLSYFCQAFCNDASVGEPKVVPPEDSEDSVHFKYEPAEHAKQYHFKVWAADNKGITGEPAITGVVISRPSSGKINKLERTKECPSTDIAISWDAVDGCDEYEVKIKKSGQQKFESCIRTTETKCRYRCQCPGSKYGVRVRGICSLVRGNWSEKVTVELVPAEVELIEVEDEQQPVEKVQLKWKELEPKPKGYHITLYQGENKLQDEKMEETQHVFEEVTKSGLLYYCTVAGYNDAGDGKPVRTRNYRIKWNIPNLLLITHDENDPSRRAKISWDKPVGVNCFRLEIENNQLGTVIPLKLTKDNYVFESGIPGNTYSVRLYCGCDGLYDSRYVEATVSMKPEPPTNIKAVADSRISGIIVTFKEIAAQQRSYEVCAKRISETEEKVDNVTVPTIQERVSLRNLVPGASYEVSVTSLAKDEKSRTITLDELIQTFPGSVKNLCSKLEDGIITYDWDPPQVPPDEYIIYWKVNNDLVYEESTEKCTFTKRVVKGAQSYELGVAASNSAGRGKITRLETFIPVPNTVKNIHSKEDDGAIVYEWDALETAPDEYIVQWRVNNEAITEEITEETNFKIRFLEPAHSYNLRVMASNSAGNGKMSTWNTFITNPLPPRNLKVISNENSPTTSFIVKFEDDPHPLKKYRVTAVVEESGEDVEKASVVTQEFISYINGLDPGRSYFFKVQTVFCGKRSWELFYTKH